jgi:hypothetical protein
MLSKKLAVALGAGIFALGAATSAQAATITVNDSGDSGSGTLRDAINSANNRPNLDTIEFRMGAGVHTIRPTTPLPTIAHHVILDGYAGPGEPATPDAPAALAVVLDAVNVDDALVIESDGVSVKGLNIVNARKEGVHIEGSNNTIAGNYIGTDVDGSEAAPNDLEGVRVSSGDDNLIGGPDPADRNLIAGSVFADVLVESGTGNTVQNNHIGTDLAGTTDLGDARGVQLTSSGNNVLGNLISGESTAVEIAADDNVVQGNRVGTNAAGTAALPNSTGVTVVGGDDNVIGGPGEGEGNLLSGNERSGVELHRFSTTDPAERNTVEGNLIGTTRTGRRPLPNGESGVSVSDSDNNTIGGTADGAGNVISGNAGAGVELVDADDNAVFGNSIGTDAAGTLDVGNGGSGVEIDGADNSIGDTGEGTGNTIAHNGEDGVTVTDGAGNSVLRNSIHDDHGLAIDLGADGATANDDFDQDGDSGPNGLQNGPEIDSATATEVFWSLESEKTTRYRLEFYANDDCSAAHVTEAQTFVGSITVSTDANGHADDGGDGTPITLPAGAGPNISMTATKLEDKRPTSEVSPCEHI